MKTNEPLLVTDGPAVAAGGLTHRVWEPTAAGPHPTVVMVHGRSGDENVMWIFARTLPREWLVVAPRAPYADPRGGYSWEITLDERWPTAGDFEPGAIALQQFLSALPALYQADAGRLFVMGFSQGAALGYLTTMRNGVAIQGVAGLVGFMAEGVESDSGLRDRPVFMAVGRQDATIPLAKAEACAGRLIRAGAQLDYRAYDTGHRLNAAGMRDLAHWWQTQADRLPVNTTSQPE